MGIFGFFEKKTEARRKGAEEEGSELDAYAGIRVEVTTTDGYMLFAARISEVEGSSVKLCQLSGTDPGGESGPIRVRIRGYSSSDKTAVCMEGLIMPVSEDEWKAEDIVVTRTGNDRAYFRLDIDLDAVVATSGGGVGERNCKLRNISLGGACIISDYKVEKDEMILLKVRLAGDAPESSIFCRALRVTEKGEDGYEYGCQFLGLNEEDQKRITQMILETQRGGRNRDAS